MAAPTNPAKQIFAATHLGVAICGPVINWQTQSEGVRFIKYAQCEFMFMLDVPWTKLGRLDLLPAVAKFHRDHHPELSPLHGPWTIAMQVFRMGLTPDGMGITGDVRMMCRSITIAAPN